MNKIKVAIYGCGQFANSTHIPNLLSIDGVEIVALCDIDQDQLQVTAERFGIHATYQDGLDMLERERVDVLYSIIPAYAREKSEVEVRACQQGIHLFCEKPQAMTMQTAHRINDAVQAAGVMSTVGFRERYRPLLQHARQHLLDKEVVYIRFQSLGGLPRQVPSDKRSWWYDIHKRGGAGMNWGPHAVDYMRFCTGLEVVNAQAFFLMREKYPTYLHQSYHYRMDNGAVMHHIFAHAAPSPPRDEPMFTILYEGGWLGLHRGRDNVWAMSIDGDIVSEDPTDAWLVQDQAFMEAVRTGNRALILNDFQDGLSSLAPVLAGAASAKKDGEVVDVAAWMAHPGTAGGPPA